jgi:hypothetical protein
MRLLIALAVSFLTASIGATATSLLPPINDPEIMIDSDCCSMPIDISIVEPHSDCPTVNGLIQCDYDFVNTTGNIVTGFTFQTVIMSGLSKPESDSFTCADPKGFFLDCHASYFPDGTLIYSFSGVNPADGDEDGSFTEVGEQEGIPPGGHFKISLVGWAPNATASDGKLLYGGLPILENSVSETPEPAVALTLGTGLLFLAAMLRRKRTAR